VFHSLPHLVSSSFMADARKAAAEARRQRILGAAASRLERVTNLYAAPASPTASEPSPPPAEITLERSTDALAAPDAPTPCCAAPVPDPPTPEPQPTPVKPAPVAAPVAAPVRHRPVTWPRVHVTASGLRHAAAAAIGMACFALMLTCSAPAAPWCSRYSWLTFDRLLLTMVLCEILAIVFVHSRRSSKRQANPPPSQDAGVPAGAPSQPPPVPAAPQEFEQLQQLLAGLAPGSPSASPGTGGGAQALAKIMSLLDTVESVLRVVNLVRAAVASVTFFVFGFVLCSQAWALAGTAFAGV